MSDAGLRRDYCLQYNTGKDEAQDAGKAFWFSKGVKKRHSRDDTSNHSKKSQFLCHLFKKKEETIYF